MNLYFGWYYETLETFGEFLDGYHKRHPDRPVIISEYGAGSDERIHSFKPEAFDFSTEYQQIFHEKTFPQILEREYILGSAVWNQFDFGSDFRQDSKPSINQKGLYYFYRKPKDISYYYKAKLSGEPLLHIAVEDWKYRICYKNGNSSQPIKIYSNLENVSVFLNDSLMGNFNPGNCIIILSLQLQGGINIIKAKGEYKGETVEVTSELFYKNSNSFFDSDEKTLAINMGAQFEYIDVEKTLWIPGENDNIKLKYSEGNPIKTHRKILNTDNEPIYQTALEGIESFYLNVPDGNYSVQLYFSEIHFDKPAQRIFNVYVNDVPVFYNLDLIKEYERYRAVNRTNKIHSKNEEGIVIRFEAVKGQSIINGIRFEKIN
jgi:beta-galactosidase